MDEDPFLDFDQEEITSTPAKKSPAGAKPSVIILHGDDAFAIQKEISNLESRLGDASIIDLNMSRLDGRQASVDEIRSAACAMPFLADRRLVVVSDALVRFEKKGRQEEPSEESTGSSRLNAAQRKAREQFLGLLDEIPPSTALVLTIDDQRVKRQWHILSPGHWLRRWAEQAGERAWVKEFRLPSAANMPGWIRLEATALEGQFTPQAARALADHVGTDTRAASQEIAKLLTYVDFKRPVEEDDVALLTAQTTLPSIFSLVDAMGERNGRLALQILHALEEENEPSELFGMIVRQFRLLLQVREILDVGGGIETIAQEAKASSRARLHPYEAQKLSIQAQRFSIGGLEAIYHRLLEIDLAMKTSQMPAEVAFDTFIAELAA
jgi:DNA polymerase-3 subunit delta